MINETRLTIIKLIDDFKLIGLLIEKYKETCETLIICSHIPLRLSELNEKYNRELIYLSTLIELLSDDKASFETFVEWLIYLKKIMVRVVKSVIVLVMMVKLLKKLKKTISFKVDKSSDYFLKVKFDETKYLSVLRDEHFKYILNIIQFYDEYHKEYSSQIIEEDISSIIAYCLTSDSYRDFIGKNKFKLLNIKCKKMKNETEPESNKRKSLGESKEFTFRKHKEKSEPYINRFVNIILGNEDEVYDTSLLFDPTLIKKFNTENLDHNKVNQQLETEMLSDERSEFTFSFSNANLFNILINGTINLETDALSAEIIHRELIIEKDLEEIQQFNSDLFKKREDLKQG